MKTLEVHLNQDEKRGLYVLPCSYFAVFFNYLTSLMENTKICLQKHIRNVDSDLSSFLSFEGEHVLGFFVQNALD